MNKIMKQLIVTLLMLTTLHSSNTQEIKLNTTIKLISAMSETVHSLQQERGASCGYVSSDGTKFKQKLLVIQNRSVDQINNLYQIIDTNYNILEKYLSKKDYKTLDKTIVELYTIREKVQSLEVNFAKTYSKYTQSIAFMLLKISDISDKLENKELNDALYIYSTLLMHKEGIGQKRAALSALFSKKDFAKEIFEYFLTSDTQEKIYLKSFLHSVDDDIKNLYLKTLSEQVLGEVIVYEKQAKRKLDGKKIMVDPQDWFTNVTKKINLVQEIEHKIFENIQMIIYKINTNSLITLTKDEKQWIENNPIVKIAVMKYWKKDNEGNSLDAN